MSRTSPISRLSLAADGWQPLSELYVYGVFDGKENWSSFKGWIDEIAASGVSVVVLSTFHVYDDGNLYGSVPLVTNGVFNPASELNPDLPALYQDLVSKGVTLFYSIGNWAGTHADMAALKSILADRDGAAYSNFRNNLQVLTKTLSITGIDFDFEPHGAYTADLGKVVTQFTTFCWDLGLLVTYCPYEEEQWWVDAQIRAVREVPDGTVAWWNVQCYPGQDNSPAGWLPLILQNASAMNVWYPAQFIVAGTSTTLTPSQAQTQFSQWAEGAPGLVLGFVWQFGAMDGSVASYMNAVTQGLANPSTTGSQA